MTADGGIWAIIPLKARREAKSRLSPTLTVAQRYGLQDAMLQDVVAAVRATGRYRRIVIMTTDTGHFDVGGEVEIRSDPAHGDLNQAVGAGVALAYRAGANGICVIAADLPCATADDLNELLVRWHDAARTVLVTDGSRDGTNCLLTHTARRTPSFAFGPNSLAHHRALFADDRGLPIVMTSTGLSFDVDYPADIEQLGQVNCGPRTRSWLTALTGSKTSEDAA